MHVALGPGGEFDLVRRLLARWGPLAEGIGDDAAILEVPPGERLVASTDTSVEDVHFRRDWLSPREVAYRATQAALSDLAAMAATPTGLLLALTLPDRWVDALDALADGVAEAARETGTPIVGGDLTAGTRLVIGCTVLGHAARPVTRAGARDGDLVYVTGRLGGPASALAALQAGREPDPTHRARFARPVARLAAARWLAAHGARALIDISDGLASELRHLAAASQVALRVRTADVPVVPGCTTDAALHGGEEYELVAVLPAPVDTAAFADAVALPLTCIGAVRRADAPGVVLLGEDGRPRVEFGGGHDHFSP